MKSFLRLAGMVAVIGGFVLNAEGMNNTAENNQQNSQSQQVIISNPKDPYIALNYIAKLEVENAKQSSLTKEQCKQNTLRVFLDFQEMLIQGYRRNDISPVTLDEPAVRNALQKIVEWRWNPLQQDRSYSKILNIRVVGIRKRINDFPSTGKATTLVVQSSPDDPYMVAECTVKALVDACPPVTDQQTKDTCINLATFISQSIIGTDLVNIFGESKVVILEESILKNKITSVVNDVFNQIDQRRLEQAQIRREADGCRTNNRSRHTS